MGPRTGETGERKVRAQCLSETYVHGTFFLRWAWNHLGMDALILLATRLTLVKIALLRQRRFFFSNVDSSCWIGTAGLLCGATWQLEQLSTTTSWSCLQYAWLATPLHVIT
jgi:hypothetical protein